MITDPFTVLVILTIVVLGSLKLESSFRAFRSLGAALLGILIAMLLSNVGILPGKSSVYDFLHGTGVSLGIVLILSSVDIRSILRAGPSMLAAFGIGALGSAVGGICSALLLYSDIGEETWKLTGQFIATYTGGGMNFAALGQAFKTSSDLFAAGIAADVILTAMWMAICLIVPVIAGGKKYNVARTKVVAPDGPVTLEQSLYSSGRVITLVNLSALVATAVAVVWSASVLARIVPLVPEVLWITTISLLLAQLAVFKRLVGTAMLGNYLILLFLASNGAQSVVANIVRIGPGVFYFACITVAIHGVVLFGLGRMLKFDFGTLVIASQACVGGAASAVAMASARGLTEKLLPGVAVGLLGYAVGNYIGFVAAMAIRSALL